MSSMNRWRYCRFGARVGASSSLRRAPSRADDTRLVGEHDGLDTVPDTELGEHMADVGLRGRFTDVQGTRDLAVAEPARQEPQHFELTVGQVPQPRIVDRFGLGSTSELFDQSSRDRRGEQRPRR
jgi:hypothetical protein